MQEIVKKSLSGSTKYNHLIFPDNPHIKSFAASISLKNYYSKLDPDYNSQINWKLYLRTRKRFLAEHFAKNGKYICGYCKRDDLSINHKDERFLTIDHIIPRSRGGSFTSKDKMIVCCAKCNHDKGNLSKDDFLGRSNSLFNVFNS